MILRLVLLLSLVASAHAAPAQDCLELVCTQGDECSIPPTGLTAAFPAGLKITSIGANTKLASHGDAGILDCRPVHRLPIEVSLDRGSIYGTVQVAGKLEVSGILRFEPNDGGDLEFRLGKEAFRGAGKFFRENFRSVKLDRAQPPVSVKPPKSLANADCWQARATAELSDFSVVIADTSAAGTSARRARIASVKGFTKCTWGGE